MFGKYVLEIKNAPLLYRSCRPWPVTVPSRIETCSTLLYNINAFRLAVNVVYIVTAMNTAGRIRIKMLFRQLVRPEEKMYV